MAIRAELQRTGRNIGKELLGRGRRPAARRRFIEAVRSAPRGQVRVNAGAGRIPEGNWINTDIHWRSPHYLDVTAPWPCGPCAVDFVYSGHLIEHITLAQGRLFLANAFIALRPGGKIRLATPDAKAAAELYLSGSVELPIAETLPEYPVEYLQWVFSRHEHWLGYIYDHAILTKELLAAGFSDARPALAGESEVPAFQGMEPRQHGFDAVAQVVLEATKPADGLR